MRAMCLTYFAPVLVTCSIMRDSFPPFYPFFTRHIKIFPSFLYFFIAVFCMCMTFFLFYYAVHVNFCTIFCLFLQDFYVFLSFIVEMHNFRYRLLCIFHEFCFFSFFKSGAIISTSSRERQMQSQSLVPYHQGTASFLFSLFCRKHMTVAVQQCGLDVVCFSFCPEMELPILLDRICIF